MPISAITSNHIGVNRPGGAWHLPAQTHPYHELVVVMRGRQWVRVTSAAPFDATAGDVVLFPRGCAHEEGCDATDGLETFFIHVTGVDLGAWPRKIHDAEGRIRQLAGWMHVEQRRLGTAANPSAEAFARALLAEYVRLGSTPPEPALVGELRVYIRKHLTGTLTLDGLARRAGISKYHLIRTWKRLAGRTPMEEIRLLRAAHARDLILTTAMPLKEIAVRAGLNDEITLNRIFRRWLGVTPGSLRHPLRTRAGGGRPRRTGLAPEWRTSSPAGA